MTRKAAILSLFGMAGGLMAQDQKYLPQEDSSFVKLKAPYGYRPTMAISFELADKKPPVDDLLLRMPSGCDSIVIKYNGQTKTIIAREIWEALSQ